MMITQLSDYHLLVVITHAMQSLQSYNPCNPTGAINKELGLDYKMLKIPKKTSIYPQDKVIGQRAFVKQQRVGLFDSANVQDCNRTCKGPTISVMGYDFFSINKETSD